MIVCGKWMWDGGGGVETFGQLHFFSVFFLLSRRVSREGRDATASGFDNMTFSEVRHYRLGGRQATRKKAKRNKRLEHIDGISFDMPEESFYPFILVTRGEGMDESQPQNGLPS